MPGPANEHRNSIEDVVSLLPTLRLAASRMLKSRDMDAIDHLVERTLLSAISDVERSPDNGSLMQWLYGIMAGIAEMSDL